jgi:hypothetical protein
VTTFSVDITARKKSEERLTLLAKVAAAPSCIQFVTIPFMISPFMH